jgi:hypothetical protein
MPRGLSSFTVLSSYVPHTTVLSIYVVREIKWHFCCPAVLGRDEEIHFKVNFWGQPTAISLPLTRRKRGG